MTDPTSSPSPAPSPPRARTGWALLGLLPGLVLLGIGLANQHVTTGEATVEDVRITIKPNFSGQAAESVERVRPGNRDYYLLIQRPTGEPWRSEVYADTPVGGGLSWRLDPPWLLSDVGRVEIWDENFFSDQLQDHVTPEGSRTADGQTFRVELCGQQPQPLWWPTALMAAGGAICGVSVIRFLWKQAL